LMALWTAKTFTSRADFQARPHAKSSQLHPLQLSMAMWFTKHFLFKKARLSRVSCF